MVKVLIPVPLRSRSSGDSSLDLNAGTVAEAMTVLVTRHPGLQPQLFGADGRLRTFVNLFLNGQDIRMADGLATKLCDADELEIVPAIAGGVHRDLSAWRAELQTTIPAIEPEALHNDADGAVVLDVRTSEEWDAGHLSSATHLDRGFLEARIETLVPDRGTPIVCYCESGLRSLFAAQSLLTLGYRRVSSLTGGFAAWKAANLPVTRTDPAEKLALQRYKRHLSIPEVGPEGQMKLNDSSILIIGAGGLGCPAAFYLAAAGVGRIGLVDHDTVDASNLQRQILYRPDMLGQLKATSARTTLLGFNPLITVEAYPERLTAERAHVLFGQYDVILDATDNFSSRYLINDAAVVAGKPVVHGAVYRFDGQASVFGLADGPCYRCFSAEAPPPELAPSCAEGGVLGVLPGIVGLVMATEAVKLLLGIGRPMSGVMTHYDALAGTFRTLRFARRDDCLACGRTRSFPAFAPDLEDATS